MARQRRPEADRVVSFVFDAATGMPVSRWQQYQHGGATNIYTFFRTEDCQGAAPKRPHLVSGTAEDWHRIGLQLAKAAKHGKKHGSVPRTPGRMPAVPGPPDGTVP